MHNDKGIEAQVPGVAFVIPPPDKEAIETAQRLNRQYDRSIALWQKKQLRMRQNMIFATIKVVKEWDLPQVSSTKKSSDVKKNYTGPIMLIFYPVSNNFKLRYLNIILISITQFFHFAYLSKIILKCVI